MLCFVLPTVLVLRRCALWPCALHISVWTPHQRLCQGVPLSLQPQFTSTMASSGRCKERQGGAGKRRQSRGIFVHVWIMLLRSCVHVILRGTTFSRHWALEAMWRWMERSCSVAAGAQIIQILNTIIQNVRQLAQKAAISRPECASRTLAVITCPFFHLIDCMLNDSPLNDSIWADFSQIKREGQCAYCSFPFSHFYMNWWLIFLF